jgi:tryptophanyl-tRNA synthetase
MAADKLDPWSSDVQVKDYGKLEKEFGIEPVEPLLGKIPDPLIYMRRGAMFGHRDFGRILDAMQKKKPFVMMTGLMPSGKFHLGHRMLADEIVYLQEHGAKIYLCVADIEAYNTRGVPLDEGRKTAIEEYLLNYMALGLKPKNCDFYFQSSRSSDEKKANAFYRLVGMAAKKVTFNEMSAVYGELTPGKIMSVFTQVADILHPQLPEFEGKCPVVVPVGSDQDPHIRLSRDIAARFSEFTFIPPCATYNKFLPGLKGGKMSSSDPLSYIALSDDPKTARQKIMKYAFSGGGNSLEEHRKHGGDITVDVSYQMLHAMFEPDDKKMNRIKDDYTSGKMLSGELKNILSEKLETFLVAHQKAREKARKDVDKFLGK